MQTKWKFDVSPEERQGAFKVMIINFIERYFYLLCFGMYCLEFGADGYEVDISPSFFISVMVKLFSPEIIPRLHGEQARAEADGRRRQGQAGVEQNCGC